MPYARTWRIRPDVRSRPVALLGHLQARAWVDPAYRELRLGFLAAAVNSGSAVHNFVQQESESAKSLSGYYLDVDAGLL